MSILFTFLSPPSDIVAIVIIKRVMNLSKTCRNQQLLRFLFAQTQMTLYRPLLHEHLVICDYSDKSKISIFKEELSKYAGNCVSVSRNIIHITSEVHSQYLLQKDYWFAIYTTFFAFLITATSLLEGSANRADNGLLDDMKMGKDALSGLSKQNTVANCCDAILDVLGKSYHPISLNIFEILTLSAVRIQKFILQFLTR